MCSYLLSKYRFSNFIDKADWHSLILKLNLHLMNKKIGTYGHDLYKNMVGNIYTRQCYISPTIKEIWSALLWICWLLNFTRPWWPLCIIFGILNPYCTLFMQFTHQVTCSWLIFIFIGTVLWSSHLSLSKHCETECSIASIKFHIVPIQDLFQN